MHACLVIVDAAPDELPNNIHNFSLSRILEESLPLPGSSVRLGLVAPSLSSVGSSIFRQLRRR